MAQYRLTVSADPKIKVGAKNKNTEALQTFLATFGYLPQPKASAKAKLKAVKFTAAFPKIHDPFVDTDKAVNFGTFDELTCTALKSYQAFHGLPPTGVLDVGTEAQMNLPRCGFPDRPGGGNRVGAFVLSGLQWSRTDLTYRISKSTRTGLSFDLVESAVETAFSLWSDVTPLTFTRVDPDADANIDIRFEVRSHGDPYPFDGPFNVLAHAFFPQDGRAHFDDEENWDVAFPPSTGPIDLISVAAHEFGHLLGLEHTSVRGALMFPSYSGPQRFLAQDDIGAIQSLYGTP